MTNEKPAHRGSILALDVGDARIGVAVSESWIIPTTLPAIDRRGRRAVLDSIESLVNQYTVEIILLGLPLLEGGREGEQAEKTRAFGRSLSRRLPKVRIEFSDERYTSSEAKEILGPGQHPRERVDSVAAAVILRDYLEEVSKND